MDDPSRRPGRRSRGPGRHRERAAGLTTRRRSRRVVGIGLRALHGPDRHFDAAPSEREEVRASRASRERWGSREHPPRAVPGAATADVRSRDRRARRSAPRRITRGVRRGARRGGETPGSVRARNPPGIASVRPEVRRGRPRASTPEMSTRVLGVRPRARPRPLARLGGTPLAAAPSLPRARVAGAPPPPRRRRSGRRTVVMTMTPPRSTPIPGFAARFLASRGAHRRLHRARFTHRARSRPGRRPRGPGAALPLRPRPRIGSSSRSAWGPYFGWGERRTVRRELVPGQIWSLEQEQALDVLAIRTTVVRLERTGGLVVFSRKPDAGVLRLLDELGEVERRPADVRVGAQGVPPGARAGTRPPRRGSWTAPGRPDRPPPEMARHRRAALDAEESFSSDFRPASAAERLSRTSPPRRRLGPTNFLQSPPRGHRGREPVVGVPPRSLADVTGHRPGAGIPASLPG